MTDNYFTGQTLDDLMRRVYPRLLEARSKVQSSRGPNSELFGVMLELTNPRARLSRTETRGKPFSCLGELCWYLSGSDDLDFISYYIPDYRKHSDGSSAYGPRLFPPKSDQFARLVNTLKRRRSTRQAVLQLLRSDDLDATEPPCTCTIQFLVRDDVVHMLVSMRSNDAYLGLPHDVFSFTMFHELVARSVQAELGTYKHVVGSLHLYDRHVAATKRYLSEGVQPTTEAMPPMPLGDPWPAVASLLAAEKAIRAEPGAKVSLEGLDPYWADLIRLLVAVRHYRDRDPASLARLIDEVTHRSYNAALRDHVKGCTGGTSVLGPNNTA